MKTIALRLHPGDDLKAMIEKNALDHAVSAGVILSGVGSLTQAVIRFANKRNPDILFGKFEIVSLTGTIARDAVHIHIAISDGDGRTIGGHLEIGCTIFTTAEIVIGLLTDTRFSRKPDSNTGYDELFIEQY